MTSDLITRLSKLDGPDRECDAEIMTVFYVRGNRHIGAYMENDRGIAEPVDSEVWIDPKTDRWVSTSAFTFTASVDAAIALAERVLPESVARRLIIFNSSPAKAGFDGTPERGKLFYYEAATPAIAACIALLRTKEASKP